MHLALYSVRRRVTIRLAPHTPSTYSSTYSGKLAYNHFIHALLTDLDRRSFTSVYNYANATSLQVYLGLFTAATSPPGTRVRHAVIGLLPLAVLLDGFGPVVSEPGLAELPAAIGLGGLGGLGIEGLLRRRACSCSSRASKPRSRELGVGSHTSAMWLICRIRVNAPRSVSVGAERGELGGAIERREQLACPHRRQVEQRVHARRCWCQDGAGAVTCGKCTRRRLRSVDRCSKTGRG